MATPTAVEVADVFVSYARQDAPRVYAVAAELRAAGVTLWRDEERLVGGVSYNEKIVQAIKQSKAVVLMCSAHAFASDNVHQELMVTWDAAHRRILPLWLTPPPAGRDIPDRFQYCLAGRQHIPVLDLPARDWLPRVLAGLGGLGVTIAAAVAASGQPSWKDSLLSFGRRYGKPAAFVAKLALKTFVPGAPILVDVAEKLFEIGTDATKAAREEDLLRMVRASSAEVTRLAQVLSLLEEDLGGLLTQVASMQGNPEQARQLLMLARSTDSKAKATLVKLDLLSARFDRVESQNERLLQGQDELLVLVRGIATGTPAPVVTATRAETPAVLPMIDSREVARREQLRWAQRLNVEPAWTNELGMRFRLIPPGRFRLGAANGDPHASANEKPPQTVSIAKPFWAATFPLTAGVVRHFLQEATAEDGAEVAALLRDRAFAFQCRRGETADDLPAVEVNAQDALTLCRWLGKRDGKRYRPPLETEWEYLARAGATGLYWWEEGLPAAVRAVHAATGPAVADERRANAWGLADVLGNVAEWTCSEFGALDSGLPGKPANRATTLAVRGGNWRETLEQLRLSRRLSMHASSRKDWLGVRLICEIDHA